jgi:hypothetical protein
MMKNPQQFAGGTLSAKSGRFAVVCADSLDSALDASKIGIRGAWSCDPRLRRVAGRTDRLISMLLAHLTISDGADECGFARSWSLGFRASFSKLRAAVTSEKCGVKLAGRKFFRGLDLHDAHCYKPDGARCEDGGARVYLVVTKSETRWSFRSFDRRLARFRGIFPAQSRERRFSNSHKCVRQ